MAENKKSSKAKRKNIDWDELNRRMEKGRAAIEEGFQPAEDELRKILRARAQALSAETETAVQEEAAIHVVEFVLAYESYAVESAYVREIIPLTEFTPVPGTLPFILGIINVRGEIMSVIDIKKFFDMPDKGLSDLNKVIILSSENMEFGILADSIAGMRNVLLKDMQASIPTLTGIRLEYLKGVTNTQLVVLDAGKLLSDQGIIVNESV